MVKLRQGPFDLNFNMHEASNSDSFDKLLGSNGHYALVTSSCWNTEFILAYRKWANGSSTLLSQPQI